MAKSRSAARRASQHSRAARRATSPSINTDKSLKRAKPPLLPGTNVLRRTAVNTDPSFHANVPAGGAGTGAGVSKRSSSSSKQQGRRKSREQRLRLEKAVLRAEDMTEKMGRKMEGSRRRERRVRERGGAWEEINGRIAKGDGLQKKHKALLVEDAENGDWEDIDADADADARESEEGQVIEGVGRLKVEDLKHGVGSAKEQQETEDEVL